VADLYYYEEGYIDDKYHVYVADAEIALGPYIEENYIDANYYDDYSSVASLTCELTLRPGETVSATGAWTSAFTQTAVVGRLQSVSAAFTSAFSPTLTVDAFKNSFAVLDVTVALSSTAVATRSANVLLEHIADLNAMAAKTVDILSPITATATLSSAPVKSLVSSATLASTVTFTCVAFNVQFGTAAFVSTTTLTTSRYFGSHRPTNIVEGTPVYDSGEKKFGTHSLSGSSEIRNGLFSSSAPSYRPQPPQVNQDWVVEAWIYKSSLTAGTNIGGNVWIQLGVSSGNALFVTLKSSNYTNRVLINVGTGITLTTNAWNHIAIVKNSSRISVYRNGTRIGTSTTLPTSYFYASPDTFGNAYFGFVASEPTANRNRLDEFSIHVGTTLGYDPANSSISVPTEARVNDPVYTRLLHHFDNNGLDDISVVADATAALSTTASITAIGTNVKGAASAALTSTVTVSANAGKLQTAAAALNAAVTQSTDAVKTVRTILALSSSVAVSATAYRIKEFASNQNALFTPNIICQAQLAGVALLETQFTQSTSAVKTARTTTTITAVATVSLSVTVTAGLAADLTSVSTVTATAYRIQTFASALASASTLACEFTAFNNVTAALSTAVTVTANIDHLVGYASSMSSAVTMTSDLRRVRLTSSTQTSTATVSVTATRIQSADSALSSVATQSTVAVKTATLISSISTAFTQTATPVKTVNAIPQLTSIATQLTVAYQNATGTISLNATATLTALIGAIRQATNGTTTGLQITDNEPYIDNLTGMPFFGLKVRGAEFTASIWARRESTPGTPQTLWSSNSGDSGGLIFNGTDLMLRFNYDADEPNAEWNNVVPTDGEWHQYLIRSVVNPINPTFPVYTWQLWIDGEFQGESSNYQAAGAIEFANGGRALLGNGLIRDLTGGYELNNRRLTGAIAQVWMGLTNDQQFSPVLFYDSGFVDLGTTGTLGGLLPTPLIYNSLQTPFTGITGTGLTTATTPLGYSPTVIRATTAITANAVLLVIADISVNASQTTLISYVIRPVIAFTSSATVSATATAFTGIIADITAESTVTVTVFRTQEFSADINSMATLAVIVGATEQFDATVTSQFTLDCDSVIKPPIRTEANLLAQFTVTATPTSFTDSITLMMSSGTLTADVTLIPPIRVEADLISTTTLTAVIGSIEQFAVLTASSGTMITTAVKITGILETLTTVSTVTATITHFKGIILTVTAFNTQLTVGEVINLDPYLTYVIPAETRLWKITAESRIIAIEQETRVNIV
jgi:hypothetical protein